MIAIILSCTWLAGILLGSRFSPHPVALLAGLAPIVLVFFAPLRRKAAVLCSLSVLVLLAGMMLSAASLPGLGEQHVRYYSDRGVVAVTGIVARDAEVGPRTTRLIVSVTGVGEGVERREVSGTVIAFVPRYPEYRYGDVIEASGKLVGRPAAASPRSEAFETPDMTDYWDYLENQGIYSVLFYPDMALLERDRGSPFLEWVYSARGRMADTLARVLPEPHASLSQGMTLGVRANIPEDLMGDFSRTGTTHLLAISGMNLTIVAGMLVAVAVWLFGRRHGIYIWSTLAIVWFYAVLTGLQPPVLRAAIMLSFFLVAALFGRQRSGIIALFLSAAIIAGFSPAVLRDASFQLSFMAMAGLVFVYPRLQSMAKRVVERFTSEGRLRAVAGMTVDTVVISFAAILATWPLIAYYFGVVSWVGMPATFATLPAMPAMIVTGIVSGILGIAFLPLGQVMGLLAWLPLAYFLLAVDGFARMPAASYETGTVAPAFVVTYYVALGALLASWAYRPRIAAVWRRTSAIVSRLPWKWASAALLLPAICVWLVGAAMPDSRLHVTFLDVGQGDAILIESGRHQILVDGGPDPQATLLGLGRKMPFWDRTLELVILTHPHTDHMAGLVEVLKRYKVERLIAPGITGGSPVFAEWQRLIVDRQIECETPRGQVITIGPEVTLSILSPAGPALPGAPSDIDDNGIVLRARYGQISFLLTADIMWDTEMALISQRASLDSTVLKIAHHGSATSTGGEFLEVVSPQVAVISVGADNGFGHPDGDVLSRLTSRLGPGSIYRTDQHGAVEFITDGDRLWVKTDVVN